MKADGDGDARGSRARRAGRDVERVDGEAATERRRAARERGPIVLAQLALVAAGGRTKQGGEGFTHLLGGDGADGEIDVGVPAIDRRRNELEADGVARVAGARGRRGEGRARVEMIASAGRFAAHI